MKVFYNKLIFILFEYLLTLNQISQGVYTSVDQKFMESLVYRTRTLTLGDWKSFVFTAPFRWCRQNYERSLTRFGMQVMIDAEFRIDLRSAKTDYELALTNAMRD